MLRWLRQLFKEVDEDLRLSLLVYEEEVLCGESSRCLDFRRSSFIGSIGLGAGFPIPV